MAVPFPVNDALKCIKFTLLSCCRDITEHSRLLNSYTCDEPSMHDNTIIGKKRDSSVTDRLRHAKTFEVNTVPSQNCDEQHFSKFRYRKLII